MTEVGQLSPLVFDSMCLSHSLADRLDVLRDLYVGRMCHTTHVVREEHWRASPRGFNGSGLQVEISRRLSCSEPSQFQMVRTRSE
jgi:hypothetical protein